VTNPTAIVVQELDLSDDEIRPGIARGVMHIIDLCTVGRYLWSELPMVVVDYIIDQAGY